jgi:ATP-binding cassette, subfamily B, bacterial
MKMKERFHAICRFLTMVSQGNHRVLFWLLGSAFAAATLPYLSLFFSARILNLLLAKSYRACLYTVVVFLLTQYGLGLFEKICRQYLDGQKELCLARTEQKITAKALELEFEKFEKTETMDAIRRTNVSSMGSGNVGDQLIVIHTLITSLLSVLYALFFLLRLFLLSDSSRNNFFTSSFSMLALLLLCGVQLALSSRINRRSTQKKIELNQGNDHSNSVANYLVNVMLEERRADDIRIGHLDHFLDVQFGKAMEHFLPMYLDFARFSAITDGKNALLSLLSNFAAYLVIGARALYGVLPIGDVLLYAGSVTRAMSDLQTFLATGSEFDYINSYLSTYEDFIAQPSMAYDGTLPIEKRDDGQYEFAFHDVSFSYPGTDLPVLEHVTLSFAVGDKTALVGRNGAGKTTLIKLLCRLYEPTSGYITLNGIDIRKYNYKEYTQAFSVVFQDFHLFSLPLDENIAAGTEIDEAALQSSLAKVGLTDRVQQLPQGVRTRLYNNNGSGVDLSGGEAQRTAIARALYKDAPFVILDEPTAALDPIAEAEIYEQFSQMTAGKTAVYISHRMSSCKFCDRIIVLDHGRIAEDGTHDTLLANHGIYANLYETQAQYYT